MAEKIVTAQLGGISLVSTGNAEEPTSDSPSLEQTEGQDVPQPAEVDAIAEETIDKEEAEAQSSQETVDIITQEEAPATEIPISQGAVDLDQVMAGLKAQMIDKMTDQLMQTLQMAEGTLKLLEGAYKINAGIGSYIQGIDQIYAGVQELIKNTPALNSGIAALDDGAGKLAAGAGELKEGTSEFKNGTRELKDGGQELREGVKELRDGSKELKDGTVKLNDEGIQKLIDMFNGDLQELSDRMDAVKSVAKAYQSFSGISDGVQGNVRFIYKTAAIEK